VEIQQIEYDAVGEIAEATVVDNEALSGIDHLVTSKYMRSMEPQVQQTLM
jgi:uncharacterized protein